MRRPRLHYDRFHTVGRCRSAVAIDREYSEAVGLRDRRAVVCETCLWRIPIQAAIGV